MHLPEGLLEAIETEIGRFDWKELVEARRELTDRYRSKHNILISKDSHRAAYIAFRMPATYCVIKQILEDAGHRIALEEIHSLLDLGAGPGTVFLAGKSLMPSLQQAHLIEKDASFAAIGKKLITDNVTWEIADATQVEKLPKKDLVTVSYCIGELSESSIQPFIEKCWHAAEKYLLIVEPGTPEGFERIRAVRKQLIEAGGYMVAPCPHIVKCPMEGGDWCHFFVRVERSSLHRRIKEGDLGYEDEKYSYVMFSKTPVALPETRVLRHPMRRSGHVKLTLCTPQGLKLETITKKSGDLYRQAKKADWGDPFPDY